MIDNSPAPGFSVADEIISVTIDAVNGGRISSLQVHGEELLWTRADLDTSTPEPIAWGMYPMAPFAGRIALGDLTWRSERHRLRINLGPHSIHGTVFDRPWQADRINEQLIEISTELGEHWPWSGQCVQRFELDPATPGLLRTTIEVHADTVAFPASVGWHPWFRTTTPSGARLSPFRPDLMGHLTQQLERGADGIATGRWIPVTDSAWDDCFDGVTWPLTLQWIAGSGLRRTVEISSDTPYAVIYDERAEAWCVEPQSAPPGAVDEPTAGRLGVGAAVVEPGAPLILHAAWQTSSD
jgi:aldose 1-epimerase